MSEDSIVRDALDTYVPLRLERRPAWSDVVERAGAVGTAASQPQRSSGRLRWKRRRRLVVAFTAVVLSVAVTAAAFGTVRNLIFSAPVPPTLNWPGKGVLTWSPDGSRIAYIVSRGGRDDVYVMNADGSAQQRVRRDACCAAWSPDGRKLVFVGWHGDVHRGYQGSDIYVANAGGDGLRKLPHTAWAGGPVWSPDGRRIAFVKGKNCPPCSPNGANAVWVMNADGSGRRLVASGFLLGVDGWSADGKSIAFTGDPLAPQHKAREDLYVTNADGSGKPRLVVRLADTTRHAWSPNGDVIAFVAYRAGRNDLWLVDADGTGQRRLTRTAEVYAINGAQGFAWSPDGAMIVFTTAREGDTEIFVIKADGSGQRNLTRHPGADDFAAWSPDGRKIAFSRSGQLYVMNADGSGQRNLTRLK